MSNTDSPHFDKHVEDQHDQDAATTLQEQRRGGSNSTLKSFWSMAGTIFKLFLAPALIVAAFVVGLGLLGIAQRTGWISTPSANGDSEGGGTSLVAGEETSYICPMMCVPPTGKPGRCPVCAMELVPASKGSSSGPSSTIEIDPRSRRVAGIRTVPATREALSKQINGVGRITYNENNLKTLSSYVEGRIETMYAGYTGIQVEQGDVLALIYSPELYSAQVEFVRALEFNTQLRSGDQSSPNINQRLMQGSRERLVELGMTESQIQALEQEKVPSRRLNLHAPIRGTVIEKMAETGEYVMPGKPIYKLADLSTVWLVIDLFPDDARFIQPGQTVEATTQSTSTKAILGTVEFIEPVVDETKRTIGVRIAIENQDGQLKPGDFARASMTVRFNSSDGIEQAVIVPRDSLLSIGPTSLIYVEEKPGQFNLRRVKTGPMVDGFVTIYEGIEPGENVVARATFLLDAQMQLQGNPSLIDPDKAVLESSLTDAELAEIAEAFAPLTPADRELAEAQEICPVTEVRLGTMSMGTPIRVEVDGQAIMICCEGCRNPLIGDPAKYQQVLLDYESKKK